MAKKPTDRFTNRRTRATVDPNEVCCEIYNPGKEEITFRSFHPGRDFHWFFGKPPKHWMVITVKPEEWCFLPHQYYIGTVPSGNQEIRVIKNFGDQMFTGNKFPSAPEVRREFF